MKKNNPVYGKGFHQHDHEKISHDPWHDRYNFKVQHDCFQKSEEPISRVSGKYAQADIKIWEDVCDALTNADDIDATDVKVDVRNSIVFLHGFVKTKVEAWRAEKIAWDIPGVKKVTTEIEIKYF